MPDTLLVWVSGWQLQCCGDEFAVGSDVVWTLHEADDDWLTSVLGPGLGTLVTHAEEHHGGLPDDAPVTTGSVARVRAVSVAYGPAGQPGVLAPVPGTSLVDDVREADPWYPDAGGRQFVGYLVTLAGARTAPP